MTKGTCKTCGHCKPTYKGGHCEIKQKKVKLNCTCDKWRGKMYEQLTLWDWMPTARREPEVGAWVEEHGAVIPYILRRSYIGKKVVMDKSTQSMKAYKVGILENVLTDFYWHNDEKVECDRSIVFDGGRQRNYILHMPGQEIFECLPWDAYEARNKAIGRGTA